MSRRVPWRGATRYEDFRQKQVQRFTNHERYAEDHIAGRNRAVAKVLGYLSVLRNAGAIPQPLIASGGAAFQSTRGVLALDQEAAHCLPCQILVGGVNPDRLTISNQPLPMRAQNEIRSQFGKVTVLPRSFNRADIVAERVANGLTQALVEACWHVVACDRIGELPRRETRRHVGERYGELYSIDIWPINREQVRHSYEKVWLPRAERAYQSAGDEIERSGKYLSSEDNPEEMSWILDQYLKYNSNPTSMLLDAQMSEVELTVVPEGSSSSLPV
jgi:hypothetical protein